MIDLNMYFWVATGLILGLQGVEWVADILNLRRMRLEPPENVRDVHEADQYEKAQVYERVKTQWNWTQDAVSLGVLLAFWWSGGFGWLNQVVQGLDWHPVAQGLFYFLCLGAGKIVIGLPFQWIDTFRVEERFGFNRTTQGTFWSDQVKSWLMLVILGGGLAAAVLGLFHWLGPSAWFWGWLVFLVFNAVLLYVAPAWLMPLFYKFTPLEEGDLREEIEGYASREKFPLKEVFIVNGSLRSSKANAFFTGFGRNRRVALYDTLVEKQSVRELVAVLAHEIGHFRLKHIPRMVVLSFLQAGVLFFLAGQFVDSAPLAAAFGVAEPTNHTGLVFFMILFSPMSRVLGVGVQALSRKHEFEADAFAARTSGYGAELGTALKSLARENLSHLTPHPLYIWLHHSHPPLHERLAALEQEERGDR